MATKVKKLYRSSGDRILAGLFGGLGEYYSVDPTILRLGFLLVVVLTGVFPGIIVYFLAALIAPKNPKEV